MSIIGEVLSIQTIGIVFSDGKLHYDVTSEWTPGLHEEVTDIVSPFENAGGAMIYFSPEINDMKVASIKKKVPALLNKVLSKSRYNYIINKANLLKSKTKMKIKTLANIATLDKKLVKAGEPVEKKHKITLMWTRTPANVGYWTSSETGEKVRERSYALHLIGIPIEVAIDFAKEIRKDFAQREVIVIDKENERKAYSISGDIPGEDAKNTGKVLVKRLEASKAKGLQKAA